MSDVFQVGDADCGNTLLKGATAILSDLPHHYPVNDPVATLHTLSATVRHSMGGTSGGLYDVGLTAAAATLLKEWESGQAARKQQQQQQGHNAADVSEDVTDDSTKGNELGLASWAAAFAAGVAAVQKYGGAGPGYRTMLDALLPAQHALQDALQQGNLFLQQTQAYEPSQSALS